MTRTDIKEHMEVIGADGVHVGTVDHVENNRIKLTKADSGEGSHKGHHHYIDLGLVAEVEGQKVRLSANSAVAVTLEEEESSKPVTETLGRCGAGTGLCPCPARCLCDDARAATEKTASVTPHRRAVAPVRDVRARSRSPYPMRV